MLLLPGDLAYANFVQYQWDSFGRLVDPLASQRPWMVTQGNHEVEKIPLVHHTPFTAFNARWKMPHKESGSDSNLYYSFDVAGVHVIMLGSYTDFHSESKQYKWFQRDLKKVNRKNTPWFVVLVHAPWYNSNTTHQDEKESVNMKASMEDLLYQASVDVIFEGHVHAYEGFTRVYKDKGDKCGPIYINIGDGVMEKLNSELLLKNINIMKENERLRKLAQQLNQENQTLLIELKRKLSNDGSNSNNNASNNSNSTQNASHSNN
ncbi:hypothetical protein TanjilG_27662 [Lupinus angustifolius]|uniref:acid phosphatase n=1 Tax=Lupinus angustifolius TaxID=3871 RepID=A0A1J7FP92_LUPAN|nr:hypothetical protein TanjilG_27662 [Lupinus angustifolius]